MHEMSIAQSLLELAEAEAKKNDCERLTRLIVNYGALSGIMPEALSLCFEALTKNTPHAGVKLELICLPVRLRCPFCSSVFEAEDQDSIWQPCPTCGESFGHIVEQGRELILARLEAQKKES